MRKLTTQEFIDRARAVHGDKYDYSFSVYQSTHKKVSIHCPYHGAFEQSPANHLSSHGCPHCGSIDISLTKRSNKESFVNKAKQIHGSKYCYSKVVYVNNLSKVTITCHEHGEFTQIPASHLRGNGCPMCAGKNKDTSEIIKEFKMVHGVSYIYDCVEYIGAHNKVVVVCEKHGEFLISPANHLKGRGCPGCTKTGFDRTRSASLYVLRSDCGQYMKIGITHNPKQRHNKLKRDTPFSFRCVELIESIGEQIANLEKKLLAEYQPVEFAETFDGSTEWRLWDDSVRHKLLTLMNQGYSHVQEDTESTTT